MAQINATVAWNASVGADTYVLQKKVDAGSFGQLVEQAGQSYVDANLAMNSTYTYRVAAKNSLGQSGWSNEASVSTGGVPPVPGGLTVTLTIVP